MPSDVYFIMCPKCKTPMRVDAPACVNCGRENPAVAATAANAPSGAGSPVMTGKAALLEDNPRPKMAIIAGAVAVALLGLFLCLRGFGVFGGNNEENSSPAATHASADGKLNRFAPGDDPKALSRKNAPPTPAASSGVLYMGGGNGAPPPPPPMPVYQPPVNNYGGGGTAVGAPLPTYQAPAPRSAPAQFANQNQRVVTQPSLPTQPGAPGEGLSRGYGSPSQGSNDAVIVGSSGGGGGGN